MARLITICLFLLLAACDRAGTRQGASPSLHHLAEQGQTQALLRAISDAAHVDQRDVCYRTPLMLAAQFGHLETVEQLLAAGNGHGEVVELLAEAGGSVDEVEMTRGWTALIWAAKRGHAATVQRLLALGADRGVRDRQGRSVRDWALIGGHRQIAALL